MSSHLWCNSRLFKKLPNCLISSGPRTQTAPMCQQLSWWTQRLNTCGDRGPGRDALGEHIWPQDHETYKTGKIYVSPFTFCPGFIEKMLKWACPTREPALFCCVLVLMLGGSGWRARACNSSTLQTPTFLQAGEQDRQIQDGLVLDLSPFLWKVPPGPSGGSLLRACWVQRWEWSFLLFNHISLMADSLRHEGETSSS